jgi:hypothetical protein
MLALVLTFGMMVAGCEDPNSNDPGGGVPTVTGVTVSPKTPVAEAGDVLAFSATVSGTNSPAQTVTWEVSRSAGTLKAGTAFMDATLNLASDETTGTLTVTATSTADATKSDTATVTVYAAGTKPTVTSVGVSPSTASVDRGATRTFTATVSGTNSPAQTVTWAVSGGGSGTAISAGGVLTVASGESAATLTVRATSTVDSAKSGTATVTVTGGSAPPSPGTTAGLYAGTSTTAINVSAMSGSGLLEKSINWLKTNAAAGTTYSVLLDAGETLSPTELSSAQLNNANNIVISLKGLGTERIIQLGSNGILFRVRQGITLILDGYLTLKGRSSNTDSLVRVYSGGTLQMKGNSKISGNKADSIGIGGGGVYVECDGNFTKTGSTVVANSNTVKINGTGQTNKGAAVYVDSTHRRETTVSAGQNMSKSGSSYTGQWND